MSGHLATLEAQRNPPLTERQEAFARELAKGMSYAQAYDAAGLSRPYAKSQTRSAAIHSLAHHPGVRRRVAELQAKVDEEPVAEIVKRMAWLRLVISADPAELTRVDRLPCGVCWSDKALAAAWAAHFADCPLLEERPPPPDTTRPEPSCAGCHGEGIRRVTLTPTDELSPAGRALFKGAIENDRGVIKIEMHDRMEAVEILNKMQGMYIQRTMNLNSNMTVASARDVTPEQAFALFDSFGPQALEFPPPELENDP